MYYCKIFITLTITSKRAKTFHRLLDLVPKQTARVNKSIHAIVVYTILLVCSKMPALCPSSTTAPPAVNRPIGNADFRARQRNLVDRLAFLEESLNVRNDAPEAMEVCATNLV